MQPSPSPLKLNVSRFEEQKTGSASKEEERSTSSADTFIPYLNDYKKLFKVVDPNPTTVIACALKDLLLVLKIYKAKGAQMFSIVGKSPHFEAIDKQAAVLRV